MSDKNSYFSSFLAESFGLAFSELPARAQSAVPGCVWSCSPLEANTYYKPIPGHPDGNFRYVPFAKDFAAILYYDDAKGYCLALWIGVLEDALRWARLRRFQVNPQTGVPQTYEAPEETLKPVAKSIFAQFTDDQLLAIGLPREQLPTVRALASREDFYTVSRQFSSDVRESLTWLIDGEDYQLVLDIVRSVSASVDPEKPMESLVARQEFYLPESDDDRRQYLAYPLEKWRVYLHPDQRKSVQTNYKGPVRVLGPAGSGKTVVAMHRAQRLAKDILDADKERMRNDPTAQPTRTPQILLTTFTKNLAIDIEQNLCKICSKEQLALIEVVNLDKWVSSCLREYNFKAKITYDAAELNPAWGVAVEEAKKDAQRKGKSLDVGADDAARFCREEYERVIVANDAFTKEQYLQTPRVGRGVRLNRQKRLCVWEVVQHYLRYMQSISKRDIYYAMYECRELLKREIEQNRRQGKRHIIVDECQDFSAVALRLLRTIGGEEHENDLFLVGDAHQRIYKNKAVLGHCGINVRGRGIKLHVNYRTTAETQSYALKVLAKMPVDDLDDGLDSDTRCQSLRHGAAPKLIRCKSQKEQAQKILETVQSLEAQGVLDREICLVAPSSNALDGFQTLLPNLDPGRLCYLIVHDKAESRVEPGLRLATMHRVKGLEFKYVLLFNVGDKELPGRQVDNLSEEIEREEALAEQRRLLYVALTRAQFGAHLFCVGKPSRFISQ
ncbi:MAG: 3'-5' exonuclease [Planctomycetia bacterium]|nr:3'-5' exonuclease [Planctomycetia bacterium]